MTTKEFKRLQQFLTDSIEKGIFLCKGSVIPFNSEEIQRCYINEVPNPLYYNHFGKIVKDYFTPENMLIDEYVCNIHYKHIQEIELRIVFKDNTIRSFHRHKGGYYD